MGRDNEISVAPREPDPEGFLDAGLAWLEAVAPYDLATVWEVVGDRLRVRMARGRLKTRRVLEHEVDLGTHDDLRRVLQDRMPRINTEHDHKDGEGDLFDGVLDLQPGHSCMVVPLYAGDQTLGLLSLDRNVCEPYEGDVMKLVELYARLLALGLLVAAEAQRVSALYREERLRTEVLSDDLLKTGAPDDPVEMLALTRSPALRTLLDQTRAAAATDSVLLIQGETGTGKEVLAAAAHRWSLRKGAAFVKVNCAALPEGTLESELFGHVKGAFTGAVKDRPGRFRAAHGGTLFLDEIGELSPALQAKLLRVLQEGTFEPVGSDRTLKVDVRVIAATNVDLDEAVRTKAFREDLYYRLNVFPLRLPPLRERLEDVPLLVEHFLRRFRRLLGRPGRVAREGLALLTAYAWPGNVRELSNVLERAAILASAKGSGDLTPFLALAGLAGGRAPPSSRGEGDQTAGLAAGVVPLDEAIRRHIRQALLATDGRIYGEGGAAALLGLKPSTLQSKMKRLKLR